MTSWHEDDILKFPTWGNSLRVAPFAQPLKEQYQKSVLCYLRWCREMKLAASVATARQFLLGLPHADRDVCTPGLRWLFAAARREDAVFRRTPGRQTADLNREIPRQSRLDLGSEEWERQLIRTIRQRQFLWRTEQAYRAWVRRFSRFLGTISPMDATETDLRRFLSQLATVEKLSSTTQRQALNALVFLSARLCKNR